MIQYETNRPITADEFADVLRRSTLGERRPIDDRACLEGMIANSNLTVTAWMDGRLVGVARSVTDFHYCCYLSDLAVDTAHQGRGIGKKLIAATQATLGPRCTIILLAAPKAIGYYPHLGFQRHDQAWLLPPDKKVDAPPDTAK